MSIPTARGWQDLLLSDKGGREGLLGKQQTATLSLHSALLFTMARLDEHPHALSSLF